MSAIRDLSPYDPAARCKKCGYDQVSTRHERTMFGYEEVLRRTCHRCSYVWDEDVLNVPAQLTEEERTRRVEDFNQQHTA